MKKFLVATDLSARSDRAMERAIKLAKNQNASLVIVHVIDEDTPRPLIEEVKKIANQEIENFIKNKINNVEYSIKIIVGRAHKSIFNIVKEENIDLVILGMHRHADEGQVMIGKVIERVVKSSMRPVLVVKNRSESDYNNILIAVDFNIHSKKSLKLALTMFPKSSFNLVHSYHTPVFLGGIAENTNIDQEFKDSCSEEIDEMIAEAIAKVSKQLEQKEVNFKINKKVLKGAIFNILNEEVLYEKSELLVLGTRGKTGISKALSLNVTEKILANPPSDILVVM